MKKLTFRSLSEDAAATTVYLAKICSILREIQEPKTELHSFLIEHYQHELDMGAIRLAGPKATKTQMLQAAEAIKPAIEELEGGGSKGRR